jgi:acyl carrier protein
MQRSHIRYVLQQIIEEEMDRKFGELHDDMTIAQFGLDSVDYVSLIMKWEESFRIRLTNEELRNVTTIGLLLDLVEAKISAAESARTKCRVA